MACANARSQKMFYPQEQQRLSSYIGDNTNCKCYNVEGRNCWQYLCDWFSKDKSIWSTMLRWATDQTRIFTVVL